MKNTSLTLILIFTYLFAFSQTALTLEKDGLKEYVESVIDEYNIPGVVIAISGEDGIEYLESFGNVAADDQFLIGSLSKSFAGLLTLKLHEQGLLNLDDPVVKYLDWFEYKNKEVSDKVTIRNLLHQTSGMTTDMGRNFLKRNEKNTRENLSNELKNFDPKRKDPNSFIYCNLNYRLLGYIINEVTQDSFGNVLKAEITKPLSMNNTTGLLADHFVQGYQYFLYYPIVPISLNYHMDDIPPGYISSTASDMSRYLTVLMNSYNGKENMYIDQKTALTLFEPNDLNDTNYALGWAISKDTDNKTFFHDGATQSFSTYMAIWPELNKNIIVLTNAYGHNPREIGQGVLSLLLNKEPNRPSKTFFYVIRSLPILVLVLLFIFIIKLRKWMGLQRPVALSKNILPNIVLIIGLGIGLFWIAVLPGLNGATLKTVIEFDRSTGYSLVLLTLLIVSSSLLSYFNKAKQALASDVKE